MQDENVKPNCYKCQYRRPLSGDAHSGCVNEKASVVGAPHGIKNGWFFWPYNFDPVWLLECDGFDEADEPKGGGLICA